MESQHKPGYILITTLLLILACSGIVARYVYKLSTVRFMAQSFIDKQQASALAQGSIDLVMDMLTMPEDKKEEPLYRAQRMAFLNTWQTFELKEDIDAVDAQIKIYIADEQGKIMLNSWYDIKNKKWKELSSDDKKIIDLVGNSYKTELKNISLLDALAKFLKDRKRPFYDVSELADSKELQKFAQHPSFLFDVFTVDVPLDAKINPLGLSMGLKKVLGLKTSDKIEPKKLAEILQKIPASVNWQTQWDISLASFYGKRYNELPQEITRLFAPSLDSTVYSVIIQVTVKSAFQQLYAVLVKASEDNPVKPFIIKKLVWL